MSRFSPTWVLLPFLGVLYVYARSEGERFPSFLFFSFLTLSLLELGSFILMRLSTRLTWTLQNSTQPAGSTFPLRLDFTLSRLSFGIIKGKINLPWNLHAGDVSLSIVPTPGRTRESIEFTLVPDKRGHYLVGPAEVVLEDPFGLFAATLTCGEAVDLWVTPRILPLKDWPEAPHGPEAKASALAHHGEPSSSARRYQYGDPWRRIHWKATARLHTLMVREVESLADDPTLLWLDLSRHSYWRAGEAVETAVSLAATVLNLFHEFGQPAIFVASAKETYTFSLPATDLTPALRYLAVAAADGTAPPDETVVALPPEGDLIVITGKPSANLLQLLQPRSRAAASVLLLATAAAEPASATAYSAAGVEVRWYRGA